MTSCMPCKRAPNCATAPRAAIILHDTADEKFLARYPHKVKHLTAPMSKTLQKSRICTFTRRRGAKPASMRMVWAISVPLYFAVLCGYIWLVLPHKGAMAAKVVFFVLAGVFPILVNILAGDRPAHSGIRLDNIAESARLTSIMTLAMAGLVTAVAVATDGFHWGRTARFLELCVIYLGWGIAQQYLLQAFTLRRLREANLGLIPSVLIASLIFAAMHAPNWLLSAVTFVAAIVWCLLFIHRPNIFTLGLSHAVLAVLLYHSWPKVWLQGLAIGPMFLRRSG